MKTVKIKYVDMWKNFCPEKDIFYEYLSKHPEKYKIEFSDDPDYILYGVFGYENLKYDCIRIFVGHEYKFPDFNLCDYATGNCCMDFSERYYYYPGIYMPTYRLTYSKMEKRDSIKIYANDREFCAFTYSNRYANKKREQFYRELSKYKKVDSGGRFLNNVGGPVSDKIEFESGHKFSIAFENESAPGYVTEKIAESFAAGCIPIYWGDPLIKRMFNEKSFINVNDYNSIEETIEAVKRIDNDDDLYYQMVNEPNIKNEFKLEQIISGFDDYAGKIFDMPLESARRLSVRWYLEEQRRNMGLYSMAKVKNKIHAYSKGIKYRVKNIKRNG